MSVVDIIASAPKQQFARKAYFWKQLKAISTSFPTFFRTGQRINYRKIGAADLEIEYKMLINSRQQQTQLRQLFTKLAKETSLVFKKREQSRQTAILKQKYFEIAREAAINASKREKILAVKRFFDSSTLGFRIKPKLKVEESKGEMEIDVTNIPFRELIKYIRFDKDYILLLQADDRFLPLNEERLSKIESLFELDSESFSLSLSSVNLTGSEREIIIDMDNDVVSSIKFVWKLKKRQRPNGGYFPYYHNLDKVDLTRYGIYRDEKETDKYELNCIEIALKNAGIKAEDFNKLKTLIKTRFIPQKDLKIIAEQLNIHIKLKKGDNTFNYKPTSFGSAPEPKSKMIELGLLNEHYFLIEKTEYTSYSIKNYFDVCEKSDFNRIIKFDGKKYKRANDRFISSFDLIKLLLEYKDTHLTEINMSNCGSFSQYVNRSFDYDVLQEITAKEAKACENAVLKPPSIFKVSPFPKGEQIPYDFLYFDTETTTDGEQHMPYMICSETRSGDKKYFTGDSCILQWLRSLDRNYVCIAHNLRYDFQFLIKYLDDVQDMIKTGNKIKSISGKFYNIVTKKTILLHFKDSYAFISMKLEKFPECFKLDKDKIEKEIIPYGAYNTNTVNKPFLSINYAASFLEKDDKQQFINNIKEWGLSLENKDNGEECFNHIAYSRIYCEMDVTVLKLGYETFRQWMLTVTSLDIDNAVSIPQIAYTYGLNCGVFDGCYKLSGVARDFIQRSVVGGRCMTRQNKKFAINHKVDDFDGRSLYPSAMWRIPGLLKGKPKVLTPEIIEELNRGNLSIVDGFFVEIEILDIPIKRDFPLISKKNDAGIREFSNEIRGRGVYVDKFSLEDAIEFQQLKYKVIRGYYFDQGRNDKISSFIETLYNERLKKKKEKNPIQEIYKLLMNSFYGKSIMNPISHEYKFVYGKENFNKHLSYHFNSISEYTKISDGMFIFKENKSILEHFSLPHCGVEILSMSKRIMNEVMCLAEDLGIEIYYQDTDSMHIDARVTINEDGLEETGVQRLAKEYKIKYGRDLIGGNLGQFACDFDYESEVPPVSIQSVYLGKKSYCDRVEVIRKSKPVQVFHARMKGIPNKCLEKECDKNYKGDMIRMYQDLLSGKAITFDLLDVCKFKFQNNFTTTNNKEFKRLIKF